MDLENRRVGQVGLETFAIRMVPAVQPIPSEGTDVLAENSDEMMVTGQVMDASTDAGTIQRIVGELVKLRDLSPRSR